MKKLLKRLCSAMVAAVMVMTMAPAAFAAGGGAQFQNGPYLLAPKTNSMVVVWESTEKVSATIAYGTDESKLCDPIKVEIDADAPDFKGSKMNLFHYKLDNLTPGTRYYYEVKLEGGATCKASFKTLSEKPDQIRLITLSDSHIFATRAELDQAIKEFDPDLLLHCGDMVEGTGAQAEQFSFWFQGKVDNDYIHSYPVVYSSGNHDQGGVYFNTYVYSIQDEEYGAEVEGDSSFNYAGLHIITMNSNPWGLFQMNSEATGQKADAATIKTIDNAMNWLKKDLATDAAKNADFRLIFMHHPVSDAYTKRYIPAVIEPGKVDLLLSGHTHSYARAVSSNPAVGAGTIYLTHQDARTYNKKGDFFYITSTPGSGVLDVKNYGATAAGQDSKVANETLVAKDKQQLSWSDISITPSTVLYNGEVTVTAKVTNNGKGLAAAVIPVVDNGTTRYLYKFEDGIVTLDPGKSATLTGTLRMETLGTHTLKLADKTVSVNVKYRPATFDYTNIRTQQGNGKTSDMNSNILHIKADVVNIGNDAGTTKGGVSELTEQYVDLDGKGAIPDHNPLMVKGIGLGWGTPYMFRMAVRETGKVTYGVCLLDDNGEFSWNDGSDDSFGIKKDQWVQYTSAFDFTTGGDSYENELHSAHVDKPAFENAPIKTWEGEPMYIGLGFKNTLQTKRNRGMYHTMLPGAVSQVRFYTSKLSENEVTAVRNNPTSAGASKNSLKIWLDFENSNIETSGSHTTEWVEATAAPTALSYNAAFAGKASITATVQTSDDGKTVKEEKSAALTSGTGKIDLTGMADAKYVRVKTAFVSDLNSTESSVPVLNEYALTAGKTKIWNTLTDWEKGTFEGAAGHQPGHVYRNYAKDFANYGTIGDVEDSSKAGFTDVANHWAKDAINYVTDKGMMNGTGSNTFSPNASTTRGMLMTVLARYAGEDTTGGATWYEKGMNWAKAKGVSDGTNPTVKITREQLVTMLYRYAGSPAANGSLDSFSDAASVNSYAANAMQWAVANGIVNGLNGKLNPQNNATRAQVAAILMRFCEMSK